MSDVFDPAARSAIMRSVKSRGTAPELAVRRLLRRMGRGYRLDGRGLPGTPDLVMREARTALFVHGCFWHGHDCPRGARTPKANALYWTGKIARNRARDQRALEELSALGWRPVTVWECELKDLEVLERRLAAALPPRRRR
jgi:DNA mismatch endonuclease (patch repair protein)